jgi:simple sugar transport system substrate-binding protein
VKASGTRVHVIVLGGSLSDPFWSSVARAVHDAGAASATEGGSVTYLGPQNYNNFGPDMARLEQSALAQHPSAVVSANWLPGDQSPGLKAIARAGIPLFEFNNGEGTWKSDGATGFVGSNEYQGGVVAGRTLVSAGVKNAICVNTVPGAQELENRCNGVRAALRASGGKAKTLELSSTTFSDPTSVTQAIKGALLSDPSVDGLITIAANDGDYAADAIQQAGRSGKVKLGAFGLSMSNLNRIQRGQELLAIDIQPYLQGYYAVSMAFQYAKWGLLPSGHVFYTGPVLITKTNVARAIATSKDGIRGTS